MKICCRSRKTDVFVRVLLYRFRSPRSSVLLSLLLTTLQIAPLEILAQTAQPPQFRFYVVQNQDTLAAILRALNLRPVYGPQGSLKRILQCNQLRGDGDLIAPGDRIQIHYTPDPRVQPHVQVLPSGEITIARPWLNGQTNVSPEMKSTKKPTREILAAICPRPSSSGAISSSTPVPPTPVQQSRTIAESKQTTVPPLPAIEQQTSVSIANSQDSNALAQQALPPPAPPRASAPSPIVGTRSSLQFAVTSAMTRQDLRSNAGGYSELLSAASDGGQLQWREDLGTNWDLLLSFSRTKIHQTLPDNTTLSGDSLFTEFAISGLRGLSASESSDQSRWSVGPLLAYRTQPITAQISVGSIRVESPQILLIGGRVENLRFIGLRDRGLRLKSDLVVWHAPASGQDDMMIAGGNGSAATLELSRPLAQHFDLTAGLSYEFSLLDSSQGKHANQHLFFGLGISYRLDPLPSPLGSVEQVSRPHFGGGLR